MFHYRIKTGVTGIVKIVCFGSSSGGPAEAVPGGVLMSVVSGSSLLSDGGRRGAPGAASDSSSAEVTDGLPSFYFLNLC